jgi:hypothetical protein
MTLKLEVGKTYLDRHGRRATVTRIEHRLACLSWHGLQLWHRDTNPGGPPSDVYTNGRNYSHGEECEWDLVAEAPPPDYCLAYVPEQTANHLYQKFRCVHRSWLMNDGLGDWAGSVAKWRVWFCVDGDGKTHITRVEGISLEDAQRIDLFAMRPCYSSMTNASVLALKGGEEVQPGWPEPPPLKLEVGKTYRARDGQLATISCANIDGRFYARVGWLSNDLSWWHENGAYFGDGRLGSPFDLVEAVPNPYSVDGEAEDGTRDNHIERAPFWVYDAYKGEWSVGWVAGPFATRADAQAWISWKLCGEKGPEPLPMWSRRDVNVNGDAVKLPDTQHIDDMLRAVLDGKTVQHCNMSGDWQDLERDRALRLLVTQPGYRYRVKPEPRVQWVGVRASSQLVTDGWRGKVDLAGWAAHNHIELESFLRLEFDPDNGDVKATVEAP